jgi:PEGA domain
MRKYLAVPIIRSTMFVAPALLAMNAFGAKDQGYVKASGSPDDAAIYVNGQYAGPASRYKVTDKYAVPAGAVAISIRDPRCQNFDTKVMVQPGKTAHIHYHLKRLTPAQPPFGTFKLSGGQPDSYSPSAGGDGAVYINGKYYGYVDQLKDSVTGLLLNPGTYDLRIDSSTYGAIQRKISIQANKTTFFALP